MKIANILHRLYNRNFEIIKTKEGFRCSKEIPQGYSFFEYAVQFLDEGKESLIIGISEYLPINPE